MTAPGPPYPASPAGGHPASPAAPPPAPAGAPAPPPGPGAVPPFAAPPTEGRQARLWLGLGVGALALLLCCGGGGAAVVGLAVSNLQAVREQGKTATEHYYQGLRDRNYDESYDALCDDAQRRESRAQFERRVSEQPQVTAYRVGDVDPNTLTVPVDVTFAGGDRRTQQVTLAPDGGTGSIEVCGIS
ncbi:hypothetical protein [Micromonospora siamensis]|uniref:Uncharacterized protein n=1 Tax=Micromonospora siamensis TaxID=299152 RepID=A0A1C5JST6_9ACTN|nr:hypothetical protein [Micromonospora siamensis]SCG73650.1 hypothetical protein GA0074704_4937 [Micromonospora siamensis]